MTFLHPEKPTRVALITATLRKDKNQQRHLRSTFTMAVGPETAWLPRFVTRATLREAALGAVAAVKFDGELEHVNALFTALPEAGASQAMPDVTVNGFELRKGDEGMTLRFGFEVPFGRDVAEWLASAFGADVWLRCEDAQPELPLRAAGKSNGTERHLARRPRLMDRGGHVPPRVGRGGGRLAGDYACPACGSPPDLPCRAKDLEGEPVCKTHAARKALATGPRRKLRTVPLRPSAESAGAKGGARP